MIRLVMALVGKWRSRPAAAADEADERWLVADVPPEVTDQPPLEVEIALCPRCGGRAQRVIFGLPGPELQRAALKNEIFLAGCVLRPGSPTYRCASCDHTWRDGSLDDNA